VPEGAPFGVPRVERVGWVGCQVAEGTVATPRTDWPNGGVHRRSSAVVIGMTTRS
jgi:hypothetical protein